MKIPVLFFILCQFISLNSGQETIQFWQITDIHYDKFYAQNGDASNFCHESDFLQGQKAKRFGDYNCESSYELLTSAIDAMARFEPDPEFILWTGDSSPHWSWPDSPDWTYIYNAEALIKDLLLEKFPNVTIVPVLGNHDAYKPDNFQQNRIQDKGNVANYSTFEYLHFLYGSGWNELLEEDQQQLEDFAFCGFYSKEIPGANLTILVLNTNLYYKTEINDIDPCGQLEWLESQLLLAKNLKSRHSGMFPEVLFRFENVGRHRDFTIL